MQVITELRNGVYADIFRDIVEGMTMYRTMTLSENNNVEYSIAESLFNSGWLAQNEHGKVRLLVDKAKNISELLSHEIRMLNFLAPTRITPEMRTNISNIITNITNWIEPHIDDENSSQSSSSNRSRSSSGYSVNSHSDQENYSGEEPHIDDVLGMGSGFNTKGGKSKMTYKSKISKKAHKSQRARKLKRTKRGGKSKKSKKSKKNKTKRRKH